MAIHHCTVTYRLVVCRAPRMTNGIGQAVKKYRIQKGVKQNELAALCGITPTYLSLIEKGKRQPSFSLMEKLCLHLGIEQKNLYKDLFIDSIIREDQTEDQREIVTLLRALLEKITDYEQKMTAIPA